MPRFATLFVTVLLAALAPSVLAAQKMQAGTWTGTISPPNAAAVTVTFVVAMSGDTTHITAKDTPIGDIPMQDVKVAADRLTFHFGPGGNEDVSCTLMLGPNKGYKGECVGSDGAKGIIEMMPPKG